MATLWVAVAIAALMLVTVFGLHLGAAMVARHQAESAADLAALAGAQAVLGGERAACDRARGITDRMRVRLAGCRSEGWEVSVEVTARPGGGAGMFGAATGRARAGPVPLSAELIN